MALVYGSFRGGDGSSATGVQRGSETDFESDFDDVLGVGQSLASRELMFKLIVIGDSGVGKTSCIQRYSAGAFSSTYRNTIGVDFAMKLVDWNGRRVRLQLWDVAGQERFGTLTHIYYKETSGAAIVFDASQFRTFDSVLRWKSDLDAKIRLPSGERIPVILLANKSDLAQLSAERKKELDVFVQRHEILAWFETSAKRNTGIDEAMAFLTEHLLKRQADVSWPVDHQSFRLKSVPTSDPNNSASLSRSDSECCGGRT